MVLLIGYPMFTSNRFSVVIMEEVNSTSSSLTITSKHPEELLSIGSLTKQKGFDCSQKLSL